MILFGSSRSAFLLKYVIAERHSGNCLCASKKHLIDWMSTIFCDSELFISSNFTGAKQNVRKSITATKPRFLTWIRPGRQISRAKQQIFSIYWYHKLYHLVAGEKKNSNNLIPYIMLNIHFAPCVSLCCGSYSTLLGFIIIRADSDIERATFNSIDRRRKKNTLNYSYHIVYNSIFQFYLLLASCNRIDERWFLRQR